MNRRKFIKFLVPEQRYLNINIKKSNTILKIGYYSNMEQKASKLFPTKSEIKVKYENHAGLLSLSFKLFHKLKVNIPNSWGNISCKNHWAFIIFN